ncbi:MAG: hypothetical protein CMP51_04765 [Flavobacteriales bacterium]|nr:hypothetical protein [Flavobacteriales bacterium]
MKNIFAILMFFSIISLSQDNKVDLLNEGNIFYNSKDTDKIKNKYFDAAQRYIQAINKDSSYYKGYINAGHSLFRQGISEKDSISSLKSEELYKKSIQYAMNKEDTAESYYNLGNAQLNNNKLKESIESYKKSLRIDPDNMKTKHNLAYAQRMLQQDQQQDQQQDKQQDQQQDQQQDKQQEKQQEKQQDQQDQEKQDQEQEQQKKQKKERKKQDLSEEEIKEMLKNLGKEEDKTQEIIERNKIRKKSNEKDW